MVPRLKGLAASAKRLRHKPKREASESRASKYPPVGHPFIGIPDEIKDTNVITSPAQSDLGVWKYPRHRESVCGMCLLHPEPNAEPVEKKKIWLQSMDCIARLSKEEVEWLFEEGGISDWREQLWRRYVGEHQGEVEDRDNPMLEERCWAFEGSHVAGSTSGACVEEVGERPVVAGSTDQS